VPAILVLAVILVMVLASGGEDRATVTASDEPSSTTTADPTTTSTEPTTTTTAPPSTTTTAEPAPTTTVPTTTTTAPPPTTTVPAGPTEFAATVRGQDQGPDYYGIFYGTAFGGGGGFQVSVNCRPGTVTVTVLEDGWVTPQPDNVSYPTRVWIYADETELAYNKGVTDGTVISGQVSSRAFIKTSGPSEQDLRIKYDCRG
jgi:hypothetical protein